MSTAVALVFAATVVLDVVGQIAFKLGLNRGRPGRSLWIRVLTTPPIWLGVAAYAAELGAWIFVLSRAPLSLAFPLASLSYCGVVLAGRLVLKEEVRPRRWLGVVVITLGVAIVSMTA